MDLAAFALAVPGLTACAPNCTAVQPVPDVPPRVQQTVNPAGLGAVVGRSLFLKIAPIVMGPTCGPMKARTGMDRTNLTGGFSADSQRSQRGGDGVWEKVFTGGRRHAYCIPLDTKMNCNQSIIRPDVNPPANGNHGLGKIRRKLGLTFVLSNPFRVPVAQSPAAPETASAKKTKP
jgi:hypothetical protein